MLEMNSHVSSKQVEGHHLTTGQIIRIDKDRGEFELWLILSPACDLVPSQKNSGWKRKLGKWLPFKAVRLFESENGVALKCATKGNHLFLNIDGKIQAYGFRDKGLPSESKGEIQNLTLSWEQFFAKNEGQFSVSDLKISVARVKDAGESLISEEMVATVVAQVRYEYAINLMQKLGIHLSRVGLDFINSPSPVTLENTLD